MILIIFFPVLLQTRELEGVRPEPARIYSNADFKLVVKPPIGRYDFYSKAVFFSFPGTLCEYSNMDTKVTYTVFALRTEKPASYIGKYIRFHITGRATNVEVIEDSVWMLKKNAITLQQRYQFDISNKLYYMTVYIMFHKKDRNRKAALMIACPFERFKWIKEDGYRAYLDFNFMD